MIGGLTCHIQQAIRAESGYVSVHTASSLGDLQAPPFPFGALVVVFLNVDVIPASTFRALSGTHTLVQ